MFLFDTHSHIQEKEFDSHREDVLARMRESGVCTIAVGCDYASSARAVELAQNEDDVWACIGVHPTDTQSVFNTDDFVGLLSAKKQSGAPAVVAVGECGLDYFRLECVCGQKVADLQHTSSVCSVEKEKKRQAVLFKSHIEFALRVDMPLMLHVRPSKSSTDAHDDALAILKESVRRPTGGAPTRLRGTCHFFTSTVGAAQRYLDLGFHISFPGVITFAPELHDVVRAVPLSRILLETDAPYAAPMPHRGKVNEPSFIPEVARTVALCHAVPYADVAAQTTHNAERLFGIPVS